MAYAFYLLAWAFAAGTVGRQMWSSAEYIELVPKIALPLVDFLTDRVLDRVAERTKPGMKSPRNI